MTTTLFLQILFSFILGGGLITFLSLVAEKANEKIAGIILMFPSTIVLGFFFLGITTSAEKVASIIPATIIPLGIVVFSSVIYIHTAQFYSNYIPTKIKQIVATFITSSLLWFVLTSPFAIWKFKNLVIGVIGYFFLALIAHYILNRKKNMKPILKPVYSRAQILLRALFMGTIISIVVLLGKTLNLFWGGIFTMFPAATFASLIILHFYYDPNQLFFFMRKAPIGSLSLFIYALSVMMLYPLIGIVFGTIAAYTICLLFSILLIKYQQKLI